MESFSFIVSIILNLLLTAVIIAGIVLLLVTIVRLNKLLSIKIREAQTGRKKD